MTLQEFMDKNNLNDQQMAEKIDIHRSRVWRYRNGLSLPSWRTMLRIEKATGGKVKFADFGRQLEETAA